MPFRDSKWCAKTFVFSNHQLLSANINCYQLLSTIFSIFLPSMDLQRLYNASVCCKKATTTIHPVCGLTRPPWGVGGTSSLQIFSTSTIKVLLYIKYRAPNGNASGVFFAQTTSPFMKTHISSRWGTVNDIRPHPTAQGTPTHVHPCIAIPTFEGAEYQKRSPRAQVRFAGRLECAFWKEY